jgi:hypothetical protein
VQDRDRRLVVREARWRGRSSRISHGSRAAPKRVASIEQVRTSHPPHLSPSATAEASAPTLATRATFAGQFDGIAESEINTAASSSVSFTW